MCDLYCETSIKPILIDGTGHISGRLAGIVAKLLMSGQFVTVVNCMEIVKVGKLGRSVGKYKYWSKKTCLSNPRKGQKHHRAPKDVFFRTVKGMLPRRKWRGLGAIRRIKLHDGVPAQFFYKKKLCVPSALADLKLKLETPTCSLGLISSNVGWTKYEKLKEYEKERKINENKLNEHKKNIQEMREKGEKSLMGNKEYKKIVNELKKMENK